MKKLLLFGAAALATLGAMAQEGTDITPKNYHFNTATDLPFLKTWYHNGANFDAKLDGGIWQHYTQLAEGYNDGLIVIASGGQAQANFNNYANGVQFIDLGGEVGQVLAFVGSKPNPTTEQTVKELLKEYYLPNVDWDNVTTPEGGVAGYTFNIFSDPNNTPTRANGFIRVKLTMNVFTADYDAGQAAFTSVYPVDNQGNNNIFLSTTGKGSSVTINPEKVTNLYAIHPDNHVLYEQREYEGQVVNRPVSNKYDGGYTWDPSKWVEYEFDINCLEPDEDGLIATPVRIKMQSSASDATRAMAYFFKDISFTQMDGLPQIYGETAKATYVTYDPNKGTEDGILDAIVNKIEDNRIFNLQGIEVSNTAAPGIYIQNGKKFIVK